MEQMNSFNSDFDESKQDMIKFSRGKFSVQWKDGKLTYRTWGAISFRVLEEKPDELQLSGLLKAFIIENAFHKLRGSIERVLPRDFSIELVKSLAEPNSGRVVLKYKEIDAPLLEFDLQGNDILLTEELAEQITYGKLIVAIKGTLPGMVRLLQAHQIIKPKIAEHLLRQFDLSIAEWDKSVTPAAQERVQDKLARVKSLLHGAVGCAYNTALAGDPADFDSYKWYIGLRETLGATDKEMGEYCGVTFSLEDGASGVEFRTKC